MTKTANDELYQVAKEGTWVEIEDGAGNVVDAFHWPFCQVDACENRICFGVSDKFCHPHSGGKTANELVKALNASSKRVKEEENS